MKEAAEKEWQDWLVQRKEGHEEADRLRARVDEEEAKRRVDEKKEKPEDSKPKDEHVDADPEDIKMDESPDVPPTAQDTGGGIEKGIAEKEKEKEKDTAREGDVAMAADGDDAVEY